MMTLFLLKFFVVVCLNFCQRIPKSEILLHAVPTDAQENPQESSEMLEKCKTLNFDDFFKNLFQSNFARLTLNLT